MMLLSDFVVVDVLVADSISVEDEIYPMVEVVLDILSETLVIEYFKLFDVEICVESLNVDDIVDMILDILELV